MVGLVYLDEFVKGVILNHVFYFFFLDEFVEEVILRGGFCFSWMWQIIKQKDDKNKGFAFVIMASGKKLRRPLRNESGG